MDHGKIVSNAWNITWNNKWLWGLGFLAALSGGGSGGGSGNFNMDGFDIDSQSGDLPPFMRDLESFDPTAFMQQWGVAIFSVICLLIIVGIVLWFVGNAARAGLILGVNGLEDGHKSSFGEAFRNGWQYIWRIFGLKVVLFFGVFLLISIAIAVIVIPIVALGGGSDAVAGIAVLLGCLLICGIFLLVIPLIYTDAYAFRGIVLRDLGITESIRHGWQLFRASLGDSLILGLIYGVISFAAGIAILAVLAPFAFLAASPIMDLFTTGTMSTGSAVGLVIGGLAFTVIAALLSSVLTAFQSAGFTLAYREISGLAPKIDIEKSPEDLNDGDFI